MKVPDDLKACYKTNVQMQRTFRDDKDTVAIAKRTVGLIERIAKLEAENASLEGALQSVVDVKNEVQQANAELRKQVERLSAPVTDAEWLMLCAGDEVEETDMQRHDIENFLANRKGAA